ncbi:MAG: thioredoxin [Patescibacteria group bacterium]|nr:thioredoxin [Patescibacteria group bacterium]
MPIVAINENNFTAEVLKSDRPVLVDFWAPWCAPCRVQHPIIEQLAGELTGVKFTELNVDEYPNIAGRYQIMSIPTLIVFSGGNPVVQLIGLQSKEALREKLQSLPPSQPPA